MSEHRQHTLTKPERISKKLTIDSLFAGENNSYAVFPLRIIFKVLDGEGESPVSILVSVPKKRLHHAVDRNLMKRQVREAYRQNKQIVISKIEGSGKHLVLAFVCIGDKTYDSDVIHRSVEKLLDKVSGNLSDK